MSGYIRSAILLLTVVAAAATLTVIFYRPSAAHPAASIRGTTLAERWQKLPEADRLAHIQRDRAIAQRPDAADVFRRAQRFAALPPEQQAQLRELHKLLEDTLAELPAAQRASLLSLHERARAEAVYHLLQARSPETIRELRRRLNGRG